MADVLLNYMLSTYLSAFMFVSFVEFSILVDSIFIRFLKANVIELLVLSGVQL